MTTTSDTTTLAALQKYQTIRRGVEELVRDYRESHPDVAARLSALVVEAIDECTPTPESSAPEEGGER